MVLCCGWEGWYKERLLNERVRISGKSECKTCAWEEYECQRNRNKFTYACYAMLTKDWKELHVSL